ncbi:MAG TPA: response regulator [Candidatus Angelobacter sp.]
MNEAPNQPHGPGNRKQRRRKRTFGHQAQNGQNQARQGGGGQNRRNNRNNRGQRRNAPFVGPMDHSYRNQNGGSQGGRFNGGSAGELEPLPQREDAPTRIFALIDDLFFLAKIQEVSRKLNVKVEFIKSEKDIGEKAGPEEAEDKPSLIIVDLNINSVKPLPTIAKLRSKFKKSTSIVGFVSHVQGDLKMKAQEAGCDVVMPRSAFSQNLPNILRRHGADDVPEENFNKA